MSEKQMSGHDDSVVLCPIRYLHKMSILRDFVTLTRIRPISLEQVLTRPLVHDRLRSKIYNDINAVRTANIK